MRGRIRSSLLLTAVRSLHFGEDRRELLAAVPPEHWTPLIALTDEARITLPLATRCRHLLPERVGEQLDGCLARNTVRHRRVIEAHTEISRAMAAHGAEFVVLKGLSHGRLWTGDAAARPQYDVDLYCPPAAMRGALEAAASLGYERFGRTENGADHLPVMIRPTGWRWRGDYYDPDQPLALELHHRFWNPTLGFEVRGSERFWGRRRTADCDGTVLPVLHPVDAVDYAAWHAVRHLLRGSLRIYHIYELAQFLHNTAGDREFWQMWSEAGGLSGRLAASTAFRLATEWFGCRLNPVLGSYVQGLPAGVERWFRLFGMSPITAAGHPNKDELFLNLSLAGSYRDRCRLVARRMFPLRAPPTLHAAHVTEQTPELESERAAQRTAFKARRAFHHLRSVPTTIRSVLRWWFSGRWRRLPSRS